MIRFDHNSHFRRVLRLTSLQPGSTSIPRAAWTTGHLLGGVRGEVRMAADLSSAVSTQQREVSRRALQVARCALCSIELPLGLMVPDGGHACADLRWYCKDSKACTDRWTSREGKTPQRRS
jgi:hypothetical protein